MKLGRPKIESVVDRKWFRENVQQVDADNSDWDHLLWTSEGISRYSAPKVSSQFGGTKNVRRVLWAEAHGSLPPIGKEVVPNCEHDNCISPRHAELMTQSEAASARSATSAERREKPGMPWLYNGCNGSKWEQFTDPYGRAAGVLAYEFASQLEYGVTGDLTLEIQGLPDRVRATAQRCWGDELFGSAIIWILTSYWMKNRIMDVTLTVLMELEVETLTLTDSDDGAEWPIEVPMPEVRAAPIEEPGGKPKRR